MVITSNLFCINCIKGYAIDTYLLKDRSLITWLVSFCILFMLALVFQPLVLLFWFVVIDVSLGGGAIYIISSYSRIVDTRAMYHKSRFNRRFLWFKTMVESGGVWDYKRFNRVKYENFGNFHYGLVGAATDLPLWILLRGAGGFQLISGTRKPSFGRTLGDLPYGDDPRDQESTIIRGYTIQPETFFCSF
jgi:hypothetical protein